MKSRFLSIVSFIACCALVALSARAQDQSGPGLRPGDQLRITVWKNPDLSGDFTIAPNGTIVHPLYREIHVTGLPITTVEERIRTFLTVYLTNPQLVVQPLFRIVVGGQVRTPNVYSVPPETTLAQAIALAGGATDRGRLDKVTLLRDNQQTVLDLTGEAGAAGHTIIESGDEVVVGTRRDSLLPVFSTVVGGIGTLAALYTVFLK